MKKVIITGATGFIGQSLVDELIKHNIEVWAIVRPDNVNGQNELINKNVHVIPGDISNLSILKEKLEMDFDVFFHLAWLGIRGADREDENLQNLNVIYTSEAVELANAIGCKTFLGIGSQAEYGINNDVLDEKTLINPNTAYGKAKYESYLQSKQLCEEYQMKHVWGRIFSVYGPRDHQSVIYKTIKSFLNHEAIDFTAGTQLWDFLYVKDCAKALYLCALKSQGGVYCIASGISRPLRESIEIIKNKIDSMIKINFGIIKQNDIISLRSDISLLKKEMDFVLEYSFEEGIDETITYIKKEESL